MILEPHAPIPLFFKQNKICCVILLRFLIETSRWQWEEWACSPHPTMQPESSGSEQPCQVKDYLRAEGSTQSSKNHGSLGFQQIEQLNYHIYTVFSYLRKAFLYCKGSYCKFFLFHFELMKLIHCKSRK